MELGDHYFDTGDFPNASKSYSRARDYCTTPKQVTEISLKLIKTGIAQHNWMSVNAQINKILTSTLKSEDKQLLRQALNAMQGLSHLQMGLYEDAARSFLTTPSAFATSPLPKDQTAGIAFHKEVLTAHDVAIYGTLAALATMKRGELQSIALDSGKSFRGFLELEPQMRKAISLFVSGKYSACLEILSRHRTDWLCDPYLQPHVDTLIRRVRQECIVLYFQPFSCVTLDEMERTFGSSNEDTGDGIVDMEGELVDMIQRGALNARIDLVKRVRSPILRFVSLEH
jgi:COP9 signalosome complex subunit 1